MTIVYPGRGIGNFGFKKIPFIPSESVSAFGYADFGQNPPCRTGFGDFHPINLCLSGLRGEVSGQ